MTHDPAYLRALAPGAPGIARNEDARPTLADLCRSAVAVLDRYDVAREAALRCASEGAGTLDAADRAGALMTAAASALSDVATEIEGTVWFWRSVLAFSGILDADAWSVELLALAGTSEPRETEPPVGGEVRDGE